MDFFNKGYIVMIYCEKNRYILIKEESVKYFDIIYERYSIFDKFNSMDFVKEEKLCELK